MSNIIGVRNNSTIVPYQSATKSTKWITVTAATDIILTGTGITTSSIATGAKIMAYADSNGAWFLKGAMRLNRATGSGARTIATVTFTGNYPVIFSGDQAAPVFASSTGIACTAQAVSGAATVLIYHGSSDEGGYHLNLDCSLASKPTWADANMEGVQAVDVYIPPASATESGIVTTGAQTIAGVKTFSSGLVCGTGNGTIANISSTTFGYTSGNFSLTGCTLAGTITFNVMRVGNIVTFSCGGTIALTAANYSLVFSPPAGYISGSNYAGSLEATGAGGCGDKARMIVGRATSSPSAKTIILDGVSDGTTSGSVGVYWTGTWQIL